MKRKKRIKILKGLHIGKRLIKWSKKREYYTEKYFPIKDCKVTLDFIPFKKNTYIIFIGARSGYKNFELAVNSISNTNLNFVIVGSKLSKHETEFLNKKIGTKRYALVSNLSNQDLNILYNYAFCLLYPSSYEGFGIPVIEAQKAGCPVIAYNGSSIPEIIGQTPLLLNKLIVEEVCSKLDLLNNMELRDQIISNGLINSARFSWDNMYQEIIKIYKEAFAKK